MYTDWEQMFDLPLDEVKRKVGISDSPNIGMILNYKKLISMYYKTQG